jgi:hypothetical protein
MKHQIVLVLLVMLCPFGLHAQVVIDQTFSLEEYVNDVLLGAGVTASNITYIGDPVQLAEVSDTSGLFSVESGLVLSSGDPNRLADCALDANPTGLSGSFSDADLLAVANSVPPLIGQSFTVGGVLDGCVLEFDFVAVGDSISFNYVFGSDEYLGYVNTQYNDIFAFFLSGPGITGPYASPASFPDGAINIAQVPGSDPSLPITVSSVNNVTNPEYYIDNPAQEVICINGYTSRFKAEAAVQCGETYHIKLAIADGSDDYLESIVVLEAGSFVSNALDISAENYPYDAVIGLPDKIIYGDSIEFPLQEWIDNAMDNGFDWEGGEVDGLAVEGCNDVQILIARDSSDAQVADTVLLTFAGSAMEGLDYGDTLNQFVLGPGETEYLFNLGVIADSLDEGIEDVVITQESVSQCGDTLTTTLRLLILDPIPLTAMSTPESCFDSSGVQVFGYNSIQGFGPFTYDWSFSPPDTTISGVLSDSLSLVQEVITVDAEGMDIPTLNVEFALTDLCGTTTTFTQELSRPVMRSAQLCVDSVFSFPAWNDHLPVQDVLINGISILTDSILTDTLTLHAEWIDGLWHLDSLETGGFDWTGEVSIVDSCGVTTAAQVYVLEYPCTEGCADESACNYMGEAGIDDGSCVFPGDACEEDTGVVDEFCECVDGSGEGSGGDGSGGDGSGGDGTSGVSERDHILFIHPNPTTGSLRVVSSMGMGTLKVFAMDGRLVHEVSSTSLIQGTTLHLDLASGMYLLEVSSANQRMVERVVLKD